MFESTCKIPYWAYSLEFNASQYFSCYYLNYWLVYIFAIDCKVLQKMSFMQVLLCSRNHVYVCNHCSFYETVVLQKTNSFLQFLRFFFPVIWKHYKTLSFFLFAIIKESAGDLTRLTSSYWFMYRETEMDDVFMLALSVKVRLVGATLRFQWD